MADPEPALVSGMEAVVSGIEAVVMARYTLTAAYALCFYDWIISLDQEVALIYSAPWNVVKAAYLFCRCYPIAVAPFHLWGLVGDHDQHFCESYYHLFYVCALPTMLSSQFILMLRTYAFSGRKKPVLALLSIAFFGLVGVSIWEFSKEIFLSPIFSVFNRGGCFAISNLPGAADQLDLVIEGLGTVQVPIGQPMGLISILATFFDCLNMLTVFWFFIQRGTLGPLGQSFLKQGMLVYVVMTVLNGLAMGTFFSSYLVEHSFGSISSFASILPSALACRLVLMLRRKASPTQTELRLEHSQMVNEALELIEVDLDSLGTSDACPSLDAHTHAQL